MHDLLPALLDAFDLGASPRLATAASARGRLGEVWRLDTTHGSWAVKTTREPRTEADVAEHAAFQESAYAARVPTPQVVRSRDGMVLADINGTGVSVQSWVDLHEPDSGLDPAQVGALVARLHQVDFTGESGVDPWYTDPVGASGWRGVMSALRDAHAPYADELQPWVPELLGLEQLLGAAPTGLRTCHRDLWADNLRATNSGQLCVFDFENSGLADPSQELALVLFEFCSASTGRARALLDAYADAGGPGRVATQDDFAMVIAQQGHILEIGCRQWLEATTDADRDDLEAWVREFIDRPLTRSVIDDLLSA